MKVSPKFRNIVSKHGFGPQNCSSHHHCKSYNFGIINNHVVINFIFFSVKSCFRKIKYDL